MEGERHDTKRQGEADGERSAEEAMTAPAGHFETFAQRTLATWEGFVKDGLKNIRTKKRRREEPAEDAVTVTLSCPVAALLGEVETAAGEEARSTLTKMLLILLALTLCCGARAMAATQWYMPDGRAGGCRSDRSVNGGSGAYEEIWLTDAADCRARCAADAVCIAYEFGSLASRRVKGKEYKRCELHHSVVFNVAAIPGFECWVKVIDCQLPGSMWRGATLWLSVFSRVHLERALFDADTNCNGLTLRGCSLERATLAHTSLERLTVQGGSMAEALSTPRCL
ncbi:hypothetical protein EMIHUDRAFT_458207 [Emiliania huxleyi CCMP1516]|uniref:Apple domain-containing protein n=2 Tax=Emiliania huxleyi TaxID=2903 RepID=A0A0D3JF09_EMIH1|nr:hypothetical protein EMIHUDRAFT_458207 [Emiliania huxleyi CCMP1516]EOD22094.1 hypothetical protein EMIHUDRAFT_458207 [Emiliania huxleyi CCMP1516]|eukprot:XP_005774523.1 hypothetical protein EMIHUDRAFT_458207 [Emiliania huxleyi CCMP1516]